LVTISSIKSKLAIYGKSLQLRLFIILLLVGIVPVHVIRFAVLNNYEKQAVALRTDLIRSRSRMVASDVAASGFLEGERTHTVLTEISQLGSIWGGRVVILNENFRVIHDTYGVDEDKLLVAPEVLSSFQGEVTSHYNSRYQFLEVTVPIEDADSGEITGLMIISAPTTDVEEGISSMSRTILMFQILLIVIIVAVAFYFSKILVRPFGKVTEYLDEKGRFLDEDISIPDYTETQMLAAAYNRMRQRMKLQEDSRQEFVSNVSHELKTPLASMKVLADSLMMQEDAPVELYREFMTDITEEIDRETKIVNDLLSLVKMDRTSPDIDIKETNINSLVELILKRLRPIAAKQNIELVLDNYKPILAEVDETKLTLAISNLVENGIKYNKPDGWVHVSLNMDNTYFFVKVEDSGIGIPEADQEYIFERFYRVDKSHSREIGGTGLGLAITKSAVLMHHGALRVYSKEGEGTTFTLRIPLHYVKDAGDSGQ